MVKRLYCSHLYLVEEIYTDKKTGIRICGRCGKPKPLDEQKMELREVAKQYAIDLRDWWEGARNE